MTPEQQNWARCRDLLVEAIEELGFPKELGEICAKNLGSPKAILRMTSYLRQAQPKTMEMVADEMLSICSEIEAWRRKKASEEANAKYNELLYYGLGEEE